MAVFDHFTPRIEQTSVKEPFIQPWRRGAPHNYLNPSDAYSLPSLSKETPHRVSVVEMDISSRFGRRVRELRQQRNLTQTEMAKKFGIDRSYISDLERGRKSISLPMVEVIALGMNVSISILFEDL